MIDVDSVTCPSASNRRKFKERVDFLTRTRLIQDSNVFCCLHSENVHKHHFWFTGFFNENANTGFFNENAGYRLGHQKAGVSCEEYMGALRKRLKQYTQRKINVCGT